jgi:hypothetical protein
MEDEQASAVRWQTRTHLLWPLAQPPAQQAGRVELPPAPLSITPELFTTSCGLAGCCGSAAGAAGAVVGAFPLVLFHRGALHPAGRALRGGYLASRAH